MRRHIWRRETEYGVRGLDQLSPVDVRPLDRLLGLICRLLHKPRWQPQIDRYTGNGIVVDFICSVCGRAWLTYDYEHIERYRARQQQKALERAGQNSPKPEKPGA